MSSATVLPVTIRRRVPLAVADPAVDEHPQLHHDERLPVDYIPPRIGSQLFDARELGSERPPQRWRLIRYYDHHSPDDAARDRALLWSMTDPNLMQTVDYLTLHRHFRAVPLPGQQRPLEM